MNILGISAFYHDSAACLIQDGKIISAVQEERFEDAARLRDEILGLKKEREAS